MKKNVLSLLFALLCLAVFSTGALAAEDIAPASLTEDVEDMLPASGVGVNEETFPDAEFRALVLDELDTDGDEYLSEEEIAAVMRWSCSYKSISDLTGLEYFTELMYFGCAGNELEYLDVSANTKLIELFCSYNNLTALNVSGNTELTQLSCDSNELTSLDVSKNTKLETLDCSGNALTSLNVGNNTQLRTLSCSRNNLTTLDLSGNRALQGLACEDNGLTALDVSACTELTSLLCGGNKITSLDLSKLTGLEDLRCNYGTLAELDISNNPAIWQLECVSFGGTSLDISQNPLMLEVFTEGTTNEWDNEAGVVSLMKEREGASTLTLRYSDGLQIITERPAEPETPDDGGETVVPEGIAIDEEHFPDEAFRAYIAGELTHYETGESLFAGDADKNGYLTEEEIAAVTEIDVSNAYHPETGASVHSLAGIELFTELERLDCRYQGLTELDLTKNTKLREAIVYKSGLESIDLTGCPELEIFKCYHTDISELDFSGNPKLRVIEAGEIDLSSIDVSGCPELEVLRCGGNRITELDLENNTKLVELSIYNNQIYADGFEGLSELDVSMCPELEILDVSMNQLAKLDISQNPGLLCLNVSNTGLEEIDISGAEKLLEVYDQGETETWPCVEDGKSYIWYSLADPSEQYGSFYLAVDEDTAVVTEKKTDANDVDGNGTVEVKDLVVLMKSILKVDGAAVSPEAGDLNGDGKTDILDVIRLVRELAGSAEGEPVPVG